MQKTTFGTSKDGREVFLYTLSNQNGITAKVTNYGANLVSLIVPDVNGNVQDVVMGYDTLPEYFVNGNFFGAVIGPNANRIGGAAFSIDGKTYQLDVNDGVNNLHSHKELGIHKRVWEVEEGENSITFSIQVPDGDMGFPGNKTMKITYALTEENELKLIYSGTTDQETVFNMTNHTYFNLDGHGAGNVADHTVTILADRYTEIVPGAIPTGNLPSVKGTPMDFTAPRKIGDAIDTDWEQLTMVGGYDHNWCLNDYTGQIRLVAEAVNSTGTRTMKVYTDLPGVQFYTANGLDSQKGKDGAVYGRRGAFCLETQFYPDTVNRPEFPSAFFGPDKEYHTTTIFKFEA